MGIHGINTILKHHCPEAFGKISIKYFEKSRIALDVANWVYAKASVAGKAMIANMVDPLVPLDRLELMVRLKRDVVGLLNMMKKQSIDLVWCWDGGRLPEKDAVAGVSRKKISSDRREKINQLKMLLESQNIVSRSESDLMALKKLLGDNVYVTPTELESLRYFVESLGLPSVVAKFEGEKVAASLAIEGLVKAVWSTDTDNYALGTPLMVTGFGGWENGCQTMEFVSLPHIFYGLSQVTGWEFTQQNMVDLACLCGNDFNDNLKGIASNKAWDLIIKYGLIENFELTGKKDLTILNYKRTREIFNYEPSGCKDINLNVKLDTLNSQCETTFLEHGLSPSLTYEFQKLFNTNHYSTIKSRFIVKE
jgi:flap endonuclease-1